MPGAVWELCQRSGETPPNPLVTRAMHLKRLDSGNGLLGKPRGRCGPWA